MKIYCVGVVLTIFFNICRAQKADCIKWGNTFDVRLEGQNVALPCKKSDGRAVCCAAVDNSTTRGVGVDYIKEKLSKQSGVRERIRCVTEKKYISSEQELRDLGRAKEIEQSASWDEKHQALLAYVTSEEVLKNSTKWLQRVRVHMSSEEIPEETSTDREFLSRFQVTRTCGSEVEEWIEWIEPITITARHPFGFARCRNAGQFHQKPFRTGRSDVDYVLLQSGKSLHNHMFTKSGKRVHRGKTSPRHYLLDAGTSTFDSSLYWFTCGYSQRKVSFDHVFAWEMTLLEPRDYWSRVPDKWKPFWTFFNIPVSAEPSHPDNPLQLISRFADAQDFVSFKLDIDHPDTELPIALGLLSNPAVADLVDEFFFELHFQCTVMTSCGWGKRVPPESHGLVLDRPHVLQFFIDLRKAGIRAHIWP